MMTVDSCTEDELRSLGVLGSGALNWILANDSVFIPPPRNLEYENILRQFQESTLYSQPKQQQRRIEKICLIKTDSSPNEGVILCNDQVYKIINNEVCIQTEEEMETPSYALDHMYAKKPKEPGTEPTKPVRRRTRKKETVKNQYIVQEMVQEEAPRINIIRQPLPGGSAYKPVGRPKILHSRSPLGTSSRSKKDKVPIWKKRVNQTSTSHTRKPKIKPEPVPPTIFEESELPQLGAFVTVCDSDYTEASSESQITESDSADIDTRSRSSKYLPPGYVELSISTEDLERDVLGEGEETEAELFLDTMFPMEEVEEALNMDFCEINLSDALSSDISSHGNRYIQATVKALSSSKFNRKNSSSTEYDLDDNLDGMQFHKYGLDL